jgi:hypothetical protein
MRKLLLIMVYLLFYKMLMAPEYPILFITKSEPIYKGFQHYADDLGWWESRNNPDMVNSIGCFAEHQWKESTLAYLGYKDVTLKRFLDDPGIFPRERQLEALMALIDTNKVRLEPYKFYIGHTIKGVIITKSGLLAACHLGGFESVKLFLKSNGKINKHDRFGTSIKDYIKLFEGYRL